MHRSSARSFFKDRRVPADLEHHTSECLSARSVPECCFSLFLHKFISCLGPHFVSFSLIFRICVRLLFHVLYSLLCSYMCVYMRMCEHIAQRRCKCEATAPSDVQHASGARGAVVDMKATPLPPAPNKMCWASRICRVPM